MACFLSFKQINKTRKIHTCVGCGDIIEIGSKAYSWTSVNGTVFTSYLHDECGKDVKNHCFGCKACDDGDGFPESFIYEAMKNDNDCEPCKRLKRAENG
jgi:hypothetical protein